MASFVFLSKVCVSPTMSDVSETKSSLYFGSRAMKITNTAYVNVEVRLSWETQGSIMHRVSYCFFYKRGFFFSNEVAVDEF